MILQKEEAAAAAAKESKASHISNINAVQNSLTQVKTPNDETTTTCTALLKTQIPESSEQPECTEAELTDKIRVTDSALAIGLANDRNDLQIQLISADNPTDIDSSSDHYSIDYDDREEESKQSILNVQKLLGTDEDGNQSDKLLSSQ